jgi:hypothetical protein
VAEVVNRANGALPIRLRGRLTLAEMRMATELWLIRALRWKVCIIVPIINR